MFERRKAAKQRAAESQKAIEQVRVMATRLPDSDGIVSLQGFQEFFQFAIDHDVDLGAAPDAWRAVQVGLAQGGYFIQVGSTLLLKPGESALFEAPVALLKEVIDREFRGGSRGVSIPIGGGVRFRTGAVRGHVVTIGSHWANADTGTLTVTDQRVVYHGGRKTLEFPFAKLATLNIYTDAIDLGVTSRQSTSSFRATDPELLAGMIHAAFDKRDEVTLVSLRAAS